MATSIISSIKKIPTSAITMTNGSLMANDSYAHKGAVCLSAEFAQVVPARANEWCPMAQLSTDYWPSEIIYALGFSTDGSYLNIRPFVVRVTMSGSIDAMVSETSNRYYFLNLSYRS